jgi:hypothetical protein
MRIKNLEDINLMSQGMWGNSDTHQLFAIEAQRPLCILSILNQGKVHIQVFQPIPGNEDPFQEAQAQLQQAEDSPLTCLVQQQVMMIGHIGANHFVWLQHKPP